MPIKHQTLSFRIREGEKYVCWEDVCEDDVRAGAKASVQKLRADGVRAFAEHHAGYSRVFIHEADGVSHNLVRKPEIDERLLAFKSAAAVMGPK